ncbi:BON domain-containing protein [Klebsiella sp. CN_Kp098]|uniref:BON domain-containing protein n=1 Tax=unclassified Klebsiella TaxID=2608929 RepID=UPI0032B3783E
MKNNKMIFWYCAVITAALLLGGCASSPSSESTGRTLDDSVITGKVKTALIETDNIDSSDITVKTWKGHVQLSGFVPSREQELVAIGVARQVKGVTAVKNAMQVK